MTPKECSESFFAHVVTNAIDLQPGTKLEFEAYDDPMMAMLKLIKDPTPEWLAKTEALMGISSPNPPELDLSFTEPPLYLAPGVGIGKQKPAKTSSPKSAKEKTPTTKVPAAEKEEKVLRATGYGGLALWKQVPGTFTYTSLEPLYEWKLVCKAKRAMSHYELDECYLAHRVFNPFTAKRGATVEFDAIENATEAIDDIIRKPTPEFIEKWRAFFKKHIPHRCGDGHYPPPPGVCPQCQGKGWVCEEHMFVPWQVKCGNECPCGAPEMSCRTCNRKSAIFIGPGDKVIGQLECDVCNDQRWLCTKHHTPFKQEGGCKCGTAEPCPECNPAGHLKLGHLKIVRRGYN